MTLLTGGEAVVNALIAEGIDTLFGLPGVQNDWLYNALHDAADRIRVIHTRHEQGAGYMALGYAQATGDVGVFNVVPGPGFLNASAALATAYGLNAPVLCTVGQIPSGKIGKGQGVLHEIPDQFAILQQLTKWAARVESPSAAPGLVAEALRQLRSNRPRPVGLEIPMDVLSRKENVPTAVHPLPLDHPTVNHELVETAAKALGQAKRPLIFVGGGAQGVSPEITQLAEMLQAPVVGYRTGMGVLDGRHPFSLHLYPAHKHWAKADAVLLAGTHARLPIQKWGVDDEMTLIRIDVDATAHGVIRKPDIAITARCEDALPLLLERVAAHNVRRHSRKAELLETKAEWSRQTAYLEPQLSYLNVIRDALGEDGIFVDELTQVGFAARIVFPIYKPRTFISTGYMGTLGYGFPTALGVKVGRPDVPVLSVAGDGGFMFGMQELATAVQHNIALVTVVFNNNQYGNVQQMQRELYDGRVIASDLYNPDFVKLAETFGAQGRRATNPDELRTALEKAFAHAGPTLVEVPIGDVPSVDRFRSLGKVRRG